MEKLCDLLGIRPGITALIGGGGKTTLMYHLARELRQCGTVAVTTTTRIWPPTGIAVAREPDAAREILDREGLVCLGVPSAQGKLVFPAFEGWDALADYTLVEADGSAGKPFKGCRRPRGASMARSPSSSISTGPTTRMVWRCISASTSDSI